MLMDHVSLFSSPYDDCPGEGAPLHPPPEPCGAAQAAGSPRWLLLSKSVCKLNLKASKATPCVEGRLLQRASLTEDEPFPNLQVGQELGA